jgi:alkylation response protein AidB-like acyl-CoA dehydrogenase
MTAGEFTEFAASVAGVTARTWGGGAGPRSNDGSTDLDGLWTVGAAQGWFGLGQDDALGAVLAALRELGRVACPLPVMDAFVAVRVLASNDTSDDKTVARIAAGELRVLVVPDDGPVSEGPVSEGPVSEGPVSEGTVVVRYLEGGAAATHVLTLPAAGGTAYLRPVVGRRELPGLAVPPWTSADLGPAEAQAPLAADEAADALVLLRLGLAARALAAAERSHEMAIAHAKTRRQFGKAIGSFGAVQQRIAAGQIDVSAAALLVGRAADAYAVRRPGSADGGWALQARIAAEYVALTARRVQLGAHHTLAAVGYFEEHAAPWLFRRVHADVTRLRALPVADVVDTLVETETALPSFDPGPAGRAFRRELHDFLASTPADPAVLVPAMAARGWFGFGWPAAHGGREASLAEQVVLHEECTYARAPVTIQLASVMLLGNSILRHGTAAQKAAFLPLIRDGKLHFCLGYSEPEAGSDLASLRTKAERDDSTSQGGGWVINGQKLWTTGGHLASHVWLATRTDPDAAPPHAGITVFLVPMDTPGITVQRHTALSGEISCTVFYDDVRVPDTARVGEVNGGWKVITDALAGERVMMGGIAASLLRQLDDLLSVVRPDPGAWVGPRGSAARARLGSLAVTLQANRALVAAAIGATASGGGARLEAPMAGVLGGELAEEFGEAMLDILGPVAALSGSAAPGGGAFEYGLRLSIMYVVGGGTNDIQRGLIARGLGLPR